MAIALLALVLVGFSADAMIHFKKDRDAASMTVEQQPSEKLQAAPTAQAAIQSPSETEVKAASEPSPAAK